MPDIKFVLNKLCVIEYATIRDEKVGWGFIGWTMLEDVCIDLTTKGDKTIMKRDRYTVELWMMKDETGFVQVMVTEANAWQSKRKFYLRNDT